MADSKRPPEERLLDAAIEFTFPASDPISVQESFEHALERREKQAEERKDQKAPR